MRLILSEAVRGLGEVGDEVNVKAGFARNYLLPKGLAMVASATNQKVVAHLRKMMTMKREAELKSAKKLAGVIEKVSVTVAKQVGENEKIFGSVTTAELEALLAAEGVKVDRKSISLPTEVKKVGCYDAQIALHRDITATFKVWVVAQ